MHVLLVEENDVDQMASLHPRLEEEGHQVFLARTPDGLAEQIMFHWPNLIIFNTAPGPFDLAGFQQAITNTSIDVPCIIVGNKDYMQPNLKSDAILISPDRPQQLNQSIQKATTKQRDRFLRLPDLIIDQQQHKILRDGKDHSLTPKEFKLLHLLVSNRGQILKRKTIMKEVWETDYMGDTRTLDVHIRWLREKLEQNPSRPRYLITVRGVGYRFMAKVNPDEVRL